MRVALAPWAQTLGLSLSLKPVDNLHVLLIGASSISSSALVITLSYLEASAASSVAAGREEQKILYLMESVQDQDLHGYAMPSGVHRHLGIRGTDHRSLITCDTPQILGKSPHGQEARLGSSDGLLAPHFDSG